MNKQIIISILLAFAAVTGLAQKTVVWDNPSAVMGQFNGEFAITKVELKPEETVLHVTANYRPHYWIRFVKESFVRTPDGKQYAMTSGAKTNEQETDLIPDSLFWMPESGQAQLALHFKPVPLDTQELDFLEGYGEGNFRFWNICDGNVKKKLVLPDEWKNVKYAKDETLPDAKINKGTATIKVKMLGYKPGMDMELNVGGFTPLGSREGWDKFFPFADDGTVTVEVPLWLTRQVNVGVQGMAFTSIVVAPGQETSILMKVTNDHRPFVAFKGYMAKTNMDLLNVQNQLETFKDDERTYLSVKKCKSPQTRMQCLTDIFNERVKSYRKAKISTAAKDLLCMKAEEDYVNWTRMFSYFFSQYREDENGTVWMNYENLEEKMKQNDDLLKLSKEEQAYTWKYLNEPNSPCSAAFWETPISVFDMKAFEKNAYNADLREIPAVLSEDNKAMVDLHLQNMASEDCKAMVREYLAELQRIAEQLTSQEQVFYQKFDDIAPESILQTIIDRYKGKAVLMDIWATWCGPCRAGHEAMKPMKEQQKGQNVKFVYITSTTSPLTTWQKMIGDIDGDHYYLTKEQYSYILNKFESQGIPTYAIFNKKGEQTYKHIGYPDINNIKEEIGKTIK